MNRTPVLMASSLIPKVQQLVHPAIVVMTDPQFGPLLTGVLVQGPAT